MFSDFAGRTHDGTNDRHRKEVVEEEGGLRNWVEGMVGILLSR